MARYIDHYVRLVDQGRHSFSRKPVARTCLSPKTALLDRADSYHDAESAELPREGIYTLRAMRLATRRYRTKEENTASRDSVLSPRNAEIGGDGERARARRKVETAFLSTVRR